MDVIGGFWHVLNFFMPAFGLGVIAAGLAKLLWRRDLRQVAWLRLALHAGVASTVALVLGLVVFGHDGKMATYAAMVGASAFALWWASPGGRRP